MPYTLFYSLFLKIIQDEDAEKCYKGNWYFHKNQKISS